MDLDELECVIAVLIGKKRIKGYIVHGKYVILSLEDPFPKPLRPKTWSIQLDNTFTFCCTTCLAWWRLNWSCGFSVTVKVYVVLRLVCGLLRNFGVMPSSIQTLLFPLTPLLLVNPLSIHFVSSCYIHLLPFCHDLVTPFTSSHIN